MPRNEAQNLIALLIVKAGIDFRELGHGRRYDAEGVLRWTPAIHPKPDRAHRPDAARGRLHSAKVACAWSFSAPEVTEHLLKMVGQEATAFGQTLIEQLRCAISPVEKSGCDIQRS